MSVGLVFLLSVLATGLLALGIIAYATRLVARIVGARHEEAEAILASGQVPRAWVAGRHPRRKEGLVRRMDRLIGYYRRTPAVESEDERAAILRRLGEVREQWEGSELPVILPPDAG